MIPSRFLIGVDSDGTVFDSMNLKHLNAFIPAALEIWPMEQDAFQRFSAIEKEVNLFSSLRGINRFLGLLETFERLQKEYPQAVPDLHDFQAYIKAENIYSASTLKKWLSCKPSKELEKVLTWSIRADALFSEACANLKPFSGVREILREIHKTATVAVISTSVKRELEKLWRKAQLLPFVDILMGQEDGSKTEQLNNAKAICGTNVKMMMVGDTNSDRMAAHEASALFYQIIPGDEENSWQRFRCQILPVFLSGSKP